MEAAAISFFNNSCFAGEGQSQKERALSGFLLLGRAQLVQFSLEKVLFFFLIF